MSRSLSVTIHGKPEQQGSKSAYLQNGRIKLVEANKNLMPWRKAAIPLVHQACIEQDFEFPDETQPLTVEVVFYFDKPKTVKREHMTVAPDLDKLLRSVFDLLSHPGAGVIPDDSQVVQATCRKEYGEARTEITLKY